MARLRAAAARAWRQDGPARLAAYAVLLVWCLPLWMRPETRGPVDTDWEWFLAYFEAVRVSLAEHGQLPGLNPWNYLGSPLWGNPQIGPVSHFTPLVLLFGPIYGMKLGIAGCYLISFETARALGRRLFAAPLAAVAAALLYALNTGMAAQWLLGQACFAAYIWAPLLLLACLRLAAAPRRAGLLAGLAAGLMVHYGVHYVAVYAIFLSGLLALWVAARERAPAALFRFGAAALLLFLALAAVRLLPLLAVLGDFPRRMSPPFGVNAAALRHMFLEPVLDRPAVWLRIVHRPWLFQVTSAEFRAYPGIVATGLALYSLRGGVRFFHVGALLAFLLLLGNSEPWHLSRWLSLVRPFDSMWVVTRWRIVLLACVALGAGRGLDLLLAPAAAAPAWRPRLGRLLGWAAPLELVALLLPGWAAHVAPATDPGVTRARLRLPETAHMLAVKTVTVRGGRRVYANMVTANVGVVMGYDPLFGYVPARSARLYPGHPRYRGEYTVGGRPVIPDSWSPNRITFSGLPPGRQLDVNLNPGRGWRLNGAPLFRDMRLFELRRPFRVPVPPDGRVALTYTPPGLRAGALLSLAAALALAVWLALGRRRRSGR